MIKYLNKESLKKLLEKASGDVCPVCHRYIHRSEKTAIGEDGQEYHADCYAQIKDKMEATPRWKRFFKAPEDYLQTENKKKLREMIIGETSNE
jgi:hypothetical protein